MKYKLLSFLFLFLLSFSQYSYSQLKIRGRAESSISFGHGENNPFWFTANQFGISSLKNNNGYIRGAVFAQKQLDSKWSLEAGADIVGAYRFQSDFFIQQAFFSANYKYWSLVAGSKEYEPDIVDRKLSSGGLVYSGNARPIPQIRLSIPEYVPLKFTNDWAALKGHIAYGMFMDNGFQQEFTNKENDYVKNALYHSKSGFLRIGKPNSILNFEGGLTMFARFGGKKYFKDGTSFANPKTLKDFARIFFMYSGGSKSLEADQLNVLGDHLGNWSLALNVNLGDWKIRPYYEHQFEDHSMLFMEYPWKDGLYGIEVCFPKNRFITKFVFEYMNSRDQSGPIYHDTTDEIPDQISSRDNYFNHYFYQAWQHSGFGIGSPLYFSPMYNSERTLFFQSNRQKTTHIGFEGNPFDQISYRVLFSYIRNWGTYEKPFREISKSCCSLIELNYNPINHAKWNFKLSAALDNSKWIGSNKGVKLSVSRIF
ncbi:MAG: capsule assembly Wzi family protein [Bacteroidales bacterium]|nr:capsule assembly Wzi family protein [Bacteroidales bacterium]